MPNDAAAEKSGSTEHGDGATLRCRHDSNSPLHLAEKVRTTRTDADHKRFQSLLEWQAASSCLWSLRRSLPAGWMTQKLGVARRRQVQRSQKVTQRAASIAGLSLFAWFGAICGSIVLGSGLAV